MRSFLSFLIACLFSSALYAQTFKDKIQLFVDCSTTWCDMNYIKTEINLVDFVLDNKAADVHLLITRQGIGSGGSQYQMIFFGQNSFNGRKDTLKVFTEPNATEVEVRDALLKHIKLGLVPYILQSKAAKSLDINLKQASGTTENKAVVTKDKWNYWVYNMGMNGNISGEKTYRYLRFSGNLSAQRITEESKVIFSIYASKNKSTYIFEDYTGGSPSEEIVNNNAELNFDHQFTKAINAKWSYGYWLRARHSTYSNYDFRTVFNPAIEYNIFPYKESNNKLLTIRYGVDVVNNNYIDSTIYGRDKETLFGHGLNVNLSLAQKWGNTSLGLSSHQIFNNGGKYYSVGLQGSINIRITGGLSFNTGLWGGLSRDQLNLSGKDVSQQDVLLRRRLLASSYNYYSWFGLNYRFGSSLNNFVNPRFGNDD